LPGPNIPFRGRLIFVFFAVALFLAHAATLLAAPRHPAVPALSDLLQIACALLAAFACISAARRLEDFGRHFWLLFAAGFFIWTLAGLLSTYYEIVLHASIQQPWPSDIIYFLSMSLPFMSLFIDRDKGFEWKQWPRIFDLIQVIVLMLAAYLFTFETPEAWRNGWGPIGLLAWIPETSRDIILSFTFLVAAFWGKNRRARYLFGSMSIFFIIYLSGETPYLYLQSTRNLRTGTLWDFVWSVPFLVATFVAVHSNPPVAPVDECSETPVETRGSGRWALAHAASILFPLIVLLMAAGIAEKQLFSAFTLVVLSFGCSVARIIFAEHEQMRAARDLEESNALLRSVFEGTGDGLFIKDREGRCIIANQTFAELCGSTVEQITGKMTAELVDPTVARLLMNLDQQVIASGGSKSLEHELVLKDGVHCFLTSVSPYRDAHGGIVGVIGVIRDVTEYQRMEEQFRQSQKMEAIGTLAGGVAHDFNNLLMVISGYSSILFEALSSDHKLRAHADQIFKAGERAASLTRQLLAFSRKQTIQAGKLNLNQVIGAMEKLLQRLIGENIHISTRLAPDLGSVFCDAGQFEQVIINLAVNARDAMPDGGRLTFETRNVDLGDAVASANNLKPGRYIECVVSDTGIGMDVNVQTRLFEPFFTTKPIGKGTGLGLSTVYGILKQSNGHISFTSQPGRGTTFRIYLPRTDSAQPVSLPSFRTPASLNGKETVLLVEDDASVCDFIHAVLASHGYRVLTPKRPQDAELVFEENGGQVDLLLTDVIMPEISGAELAKRLSARNRQMKILFMSGYIGDDVVRQGIQETDVPFLQKPFTPLALARRVREILNGSRVHES
jgi:two-component system, cell cycle sensor histidine kinase and response regulator CckA